MIVKSEYVWDEGFLKKLPKNGKIEEASLYLQEENIRKILIMVREGYSSSPRMVNITFESLEDFDYFINNLARLHEEMKKVNCQKKKEKEDEMLVDRKVSRET